MLIASFVFAFVGFLTAEAHANDELFTPPRLIQCIEESDYIVVGTSRITGQDKDGRMNVRFTVQEKLRAIGKIPPIEFYIYRDLGLIRDSILQPGSPVILFLKKGKQGKAELVGPYSAIRLEEKKRPLLKVVKRYIEIMEIKDLQRRYVQLKAFILHNLANSESNYLREDAAVDLFDMVRDPAYDVSFTKAELDQLVTVVHKSKSSKVVTSICLLFEAVDAEKQLVEIKDDILRFGSYLREIIGKHKPLFEAFADRALHEKESGNLTYLLHNMSSAPDHLFVPTVENIWNKNPEARLELQKAIWEYWISHQQSKKLLQLMDRVKPQIIWNGKPFIASEWIKALQDKKTAFDASFLQVATIRQININKAQVLPLLRQKLATHNDIKVQLACAYVLWTFGEDRKLIIETIKKALNSQDDSIRLYAYGYASRIGEDAKPLVPFFLSEMKGQKDIGQRIVRIDSLRFLRSSAEAALPDLRAGLKDPSSAMRESCVWAIEMIAKPEQVLRDLRPLLQDQDPRVRIKSAIAVSKLDPKDPAPVEVLSALLDSEEKGGLFQMWAIGSLGRVGPAAKSEIPKLEKLLGHPDPVTRKEVIYALGGIGGPAIPILQKLSQNEDRAMRSLIIEAIQIRGEDSKAALKVFLKDKSQQIRIQAAEAIRKIESRTAGNTKQTEQRRP